MANIKKLALGLLVVVLAFGFSAFKNVKPTTDNKLAPFYYGWNGTEYQLIGESYEDNCVGGEERCVVISETNDEPTIALEDATNLPSPPDASAEGEYTF